MLETYLDVAASMATFDETAGYTQVYNGISMWKTADDLDRYRAAILATKPDVVVETGTRWGGFAAWVAGNFGVQVITVDIDLVSGGVRQHPGVTYVRGDSAAPDIVAHVQERVGSRRTMVVLDSDHHAPHVRDEVLAYGPMVSRGCHLVVEDALADLVGADGKRFGSQIPYVGGPMPVIEELLAANLDLWSRDLAVETLTPVTHHPAGWWLRA